MGNLNIFYQTEEYIDKEIKCFETLKNYYEKKYKALENRNIDLLTSVDIEIENLYKEINSLKEKRNENLYKYFKKTFNITDLINEIGNRDNNLKKKLQLKKIKINELSNELKLLHKKNITLIKTGLSVVNETLDIIYSEVQKKTCEYDYNGKKINNEIVFSSIIEEG